MTLAVNITDGARARVMCVMTAHAITKTNDRPTRPCVKKYSMAEKMAVALSLYRDTVDFPNVISNRQYHLLYYLSNDTT